MSDRNSGDGYRYQVVRDLSRKGFADVALVRSTKSDGSLLSRFRRRAAVDSIVLHHRVFRPLLELSAMETYAAALERAAEHGNAGTLGCFVETAEGEDGTVRVNLWERWFDGTRLHCEQLAGREFDASDENAVVDSSEFLAELQDWAHERNEQREMQEIDDAVEAEAQAARASERADAANELAEILASHNEGRDAM